MMGLETRMLWRGASVMRLAARFQAATISRSGLLVQKGLGADMGSAAIAFAIANYPLTFLVIGLIFSAVAIARGPQRKSAGFVVDRLLAWHVFWAIGVGFLSNFVMHAFFGRLSASYIGWADSPFQFEVATASLGFAVVGFLAAFRSYDLRLAAIVGPSLFTLGAAAGHVREMVEHGNFAPGNAGVIFYMDILIPAFGLGLLYAARRRPAPS